jgi:polysaccharide biosynthesis transport protein
VILNLRQQYLDARKREAQFSQKYGATHLATVNLRNEMLELQRSILNEVRRIADSYRSDYEIAKTREDTINQSLKAQVRQADTMGQAQVTLKALESTANTYRIILENFLQKFTEAVQQQSFPVSDARLITAAEPPLSKSFPKTTLLALLGMMVGATCGVAHAMALRGLDRTIRSPRELKEKIRIECLSLVPVMPVGPDLLQGSQTKILPRRQVMAKPETLSTVLVDIRHIQQSNGSLRRSVIEPLSRFTESLRSVKTSVDLAAITRSLKFIGTVSALPDEGKSTVSANLAYLFANSGAKTLLIDGDLRKPTLSRNMAPQAALGLLQVIQGTALLDAVLWSDPVTNLKFLPAGVSSRITNSADLLGSERTRTILSGISESFDYIIIDLPPLGAAVDARAISPQIDGFIVIVEWGSTRVDVLQEALTSMAVARDRIIGGVLNKVDYRKLNNVDNYSPGYYYNKSYGRYGGGPET